MSSISECSTPFIENDLCQMNRYCNLSFIEKETKIKDFELETGLSFNDMLDRAYIPRKNPITQQNMTIFDFDKIIYNVDNGFIRVSKDYPLFDFNANCAHYNKDGAGWRQFKDDIKENFTEVLKCSAHIPFTNGVITERYFPPMELFKGIVQEFLLSEIGAHFTKYVFAPLMEGDSKYENYFISKRLFIVILLQRKRDGGIDTITTYHQGNYLVNKFYRREDGVIVLRQDHYEFPSSRFININNGHEMIEGPLRECLLTSFVINRTSGVRTIDQTKVYDLSLKMIIRESGESFGHEISDEYENKRNEMMHLLYPDPDINVNYRLDDGIETETEEETEIYDKILKYKRMEKLIGPYKKYREEKKLRKRRTPLLLSKLP